MIGNHFGCLRANIASQLDLGRSGPRRFNLKSKGAAVAVIRFLFVFMWTLFVGGSALVGALGTLFHPGQGHLLLALLMLAVGFAPLAFTIRRYRSIKSKWEGAYAEMVRVLAAKGAVDYQHWEPNSGIAINRKTKMVGLCQTGRWMIYHYPSIRSWERVSASAGRTPAYTGSVVGQAAALSDAIGSQRRAAGQSGLFVEVADVESPRWHVMMSDPNTQARWVEILRQEVNGSQPEASHVHA